MRLSDKYTPHCLADIVGQPVVTRHLARFVAAPYSHCLLFEGSRGIGKTSAAVALAAALGAPDEYSGRTVIAGSELTADLARELFRGGNGHSAAFRLKPLCGDWHVLLLEELEWLSAGVTYKLDENFEFVAVDLCDHCGRAPATTEIQIGWDRSNNGGAGGGQYARVCDACYDASLA